MLQLKVTISRIYSYIFSWSENFVHIGWAFILSKLETVQVKHFWTFELSASSSFSWNFHLIYVSCISISNKICCICFFVICNVSFNFFCQIWVPRSTNIMIVRLNLGITEKSTMENIPKPIFWYRNVSVGLLFSITLRANASPIIFYLPHTPDNSYPYVPLFLSLHFLYLFAIYPRFTSSYPILHCSHELYQILFPNLKRKSFMLPLQVWEKYSIEFLVVL